VAAWCPDFQRWIEWPWTYNADAHTGLSQHRGGFTLATQATNTDHQPPTETMLELDGRLAGDRQSARGRIVAWTKRGPTICSARQRFRVG
jgi:hypothetical protein